VSSTRVVVHKTSSPFASLMVLPLPDDAGSTTHVWVTVVSQSLRRGTVAGEAPSDEARTATHHAAILVPGAKFRKAA
jgi:hypothetical protein